MYVGPRMRYALSILSARGGEIQGKVNLARKIGPRGSQRYGEETVQRCVSDGYIRLVGDPDAPGGYLVVITDAGRQVIGE
jgi:hypothetical protein